MTTLYVRGPRASAVCVYSNSMWRQVRWRWRWYVCMAFRSAFFVFSFLAVYQSLLVVSATVRRQTGWMNELIFFYFLYFWCVMKTVVFITMCCEVEAFIHLWCGGMESNAYSVCMAGLVFMWSIYHDSKRVRKCAGWTQNARCFVMYLNLLYLRRFG